MRNPLLPLVRSVPPHRPHSPRTTRITRRPPPHRRRLRISGSPMREGMGRIVRTVAPFQDHERGPMDPAHDPGFHQGGEPD